MVVYQVNGKEEMRIPRSFLDGIKAVYGWYVLLGDALEIFDLKLPTSDRGDNNRPKKLYLYIGTVTAKSQGSSQARFMGELLGSQVSCDKGKTFDGDFVVHCGVKRLFQKGIKNVYFDVLTTNGVYGEAEEAKIANGVYLVLQKVEGMKVKLLPHLRRRPLGNVDEKKYLGDLVLNELKSKVSELVKQLASTSEGGSQAHPLCFSPSQ